MSICPDPLSGPEARVSGHAGNPPGQGPFLDVTLTVVGGMIRKALYETYTCPGCHACGKAVGQLVLGRTLKEARLVNWEALVGQVGELPPQRRHCLGLALVALSDALDQAEGVGKLAPAGAGDGP